MTILKLNTLYKNGFCTMKWVLYRTVAISSYRIEKAIDRIVETLATTQVG